MSVRQLTGQLIRFVQQGAVRVFGGRHVIKAKISRLGRFPQLILRPRGGGSRPFRFLGPDFLRHVRTSARVQMRAAGVIGQRIRYAPRLAFAGLSLVTADSFHGPSSVFSRIRDLFERDGLFKQSTQSFPTTLDGYDIGDPLGKGCNAAVYAAKIRENIQPTHVPGSHVNLAAIQPIIEEPSSSSAVTDSTSARISTRPEAVEYPLAIKMCFNFSGQLGFHPSTILRTVSSELVPSTSPDIKRLLYGEQRTLSRHHPNVIQIHAAFVDSVRMLPGAATLYPQALPLSLNEEGYGWRETAFIVMKRYRMTLREFLLTEEFNVRTGMVMFAQLLEAIRFLSQEGVAHRDLKSNNILVDFDHKGEVPSVVLSDFGCCLANKSMGLYYLDEYTDLGGNQALRPPEVAAALPGFLSYVDFSGADVWASATIGYEIFTRVNPFYKGLRSLTYHKEDLPALPAQVPYPVRKVTQRMLCRNPNTRPSADCAANVLALSLFDPSIFNQIVLAEHLLPADRNFNAISKCFRDGDASLLNVSLDKKRVLSPASRDDGYHHDALSNNNDGSGLVELDPYRSSPVNKLESSRIWQALAEALCYYSAETMIGRACKTISRAELRLRTAFLARIDTSSALDAAEYFVV